MAAHGITTAFANEVYNKLTEDQKKSCSQFLIASLVAPANGKYITNGNDGVINYMRSEGGVADVPTANIGNFTFPNTQDSGLNHELTGYCLTAG